MNKLITLMLFVSLIACKNQQNVEIAKLPVSVESIKSEVSFALETFDKAYTESDNETFQSFLHKDIIVYGTDPSEIWPYDVFKNHIPETTKQNLPKLTLKNLNAIHVNNEGNTAYVVRELEWKPILANSIRQTIWLEKSESDWKVKMISLAHLLPNNTDQQ